MKNRAEQLRREIALYRRYLGQGTRAEQATSYLHRILEAEEELKGLEQRIAATQV